MIHYVFPSFECRCRSSCGKHLSAAENVRMFWQLNDIQTERTVHTRTKCFLIFPYCEIETQLNLVEEISVFHRYSKPQIIISGMMALFSSRGLLMLRRTQSVPAALYHKNVRNIEQSISSNGRVWISSANPIISIRMTLNTSHAISYSNPKCHDVWHDSYFR